ncbi:hypothetical protein AB0J08_26620, partial [Kitasatospora sp. NPDC050463]
APGPAGRRRACIRSARPGTPVAAAHGVVLHELSPQQASLEEAFMQMTADSVEYHAGSGEGRDAAGAPGTWGATWQGAAAQQPAAVQQKEN